MKHRVTVNDLMQQGYVYTRTEPIGRNFHRDFSPQVTPAEMLRVGVFGGKYMTDCTAEFPESWFKHAKLCHEQHDPALNSGRQSRLHCAANSKKRKALTRRTQRHGGISMEHIA